MVPFVTLLGMVAILVGVGAITFGIPNNAFGFGNTMILAGTTAASAGLIVLALAAVLRAIERIGRTPAVAGETVALAQPADQAAAPPLFPSPVAPPRPSWSGPREQGPRDARAPAPRGAPPLRAESGPAPGGAPAPARAGRPRQPVPELPREAVEPPLPVAARGRAPMPAEADEPIVAPSGREAAAAPAPPPERRRFFAWTRRSSTREGAERPVEPKVAVAPHVGPSFGDVDPSAEAAHWADHGEDREERSEPAPPTMDRPPAPRRHEPGQEGHVEILKSGTVDGMAYTLYSDGSIDAEFPDGKLRFSSIDDLRRHLEDRG